MYSHQIGTNKISSIIELIKQNTNTAALIILLFPTILPGIVAVSGLQTWIPAKMGNNTTNTTKRAMIRALFHAYVDPPHCNARSKQIKAGIKKTDPSGSRRLKWVAIVTGSRLIISGCQSKTMASRQSAPIGRLM